MANYFSFYDIYLSLSMYPRWAANAYTSVSFSVPDNWQAGRIWVNFDAPSIEPAAYNIFYRPAETAISTMATQQLNAWTAAAMEVLNATLRREQYVNSLSDLRRLADIRFLRVFHLLP